MPVHGNTDMFPSAMGSIDGVAVIAINATRMPMITIPTDNRNRESYARSTLVDQTAAAERNPFAITSSIVDVIDRPDGSETGVLLTIWTTCL
jgi:hypothetical protein